VSEAEFDDFKAKTKETIAFLHSQRTDIVLMMSAYNASGVLDFAIEWRDVAIQSDKFPAALVREAGSLGLELELTHYPAS